MGERAEAQTRDNFDEDDYKSKLIEQGYTEDSARENAAKKKEELMNKSENIGDFEYIAKLETVKNTGDRLIVAGIATTEKMDYDGEIVDLESVRSVWQEYMKNPIIRYMHGKDARNPEAIGKVIPEYTDSTGKVLKTEFRENGPFIVAEISNAPDTESIRTKIREGIVRGFSIGGRAQKVKEFSYTLGKDVNRVIAKRIHEVSVVDTPANPDSFFDVMKSCTGASCFCNLEKEVRGVIPKEWWDNCISTAKDIKGMTDAPAFCSWMYHYGDEKGFTVQRSAIGKSEETNDIKEIESIEVSDIEYIKEENTMINNETGEVVMDVPELTSFIKSVVTDMIDQQETVEKMDQFDVIMAENAELKAKLEKMETETVVTPVAPVAPVEKTETVDVETERIEKLEAELKALKEAPLYKSVQEGEEIEKTETTSHLGSIMTAHFGGN